MALKQEMARTKTMCMHIEGCNKRMSKLQDQLYEEKSSNSLKTLLNEAVESTKSCYFPTLKKEREGYFMRATSLELVQFKNSIKYSLQQHKKVKKQLRKLLREAEAIEKNVKNILDRVSSEIDNEVEKENNSIEDDKPMREMLTACLNCVK
jgi:conjugal transfer/entry exclusion protein